MQFHLSNIYVIFDKVNLVSQSRDIKLRKNKKYRRKDMVNKKTIIAGLLAAFAILAISIYAAQPVQTTGTPNAEASPTMPIDTQQTQPQAEIQTLDPSDNADNVVCDQPQRDNIYGGIGGSDKNPPKGTAISQDLTNARGRITATGVCGTYSYIAGWWFSPSEMTNLPYRTTMYGESPYTTTGGPGGNAQSNVGTIPGDNNPGDSRPGNGDLPEDSGDDPGEPVVPVPEVATIILVVFGAIALVAWRRVKT